MITPRSYGEYAKKKSVPLYRPTGGVKDAKVNSNEMKIFHGALKKRKSAGVLNNDLQGKVLVVAGNSFTLAKARWKALSGFPMLGCNRALMSKKLPWPEYVMCADREVYCHARDEGAFFDGTKSHSKLLLAESLFDPATILRGRRGDKTDDHLKAQPIPRFKFYRYMAGNPEKTWVYKDVVENGFVPPFNFDDLGKPIVTGHSIVVSMLQAAVALGARRIITVGLEVSWPSRGPTHFHTKIRRRKGYWPFSEAVIRTCLGHIKDEFKKRKIKLFNLSPVKNSLFASIFGSHTLNQALKGRYRV